MITVKTTASLFYRELKEEALSDSHKTHGFTESTIIVRFRPVKVRESNDFLFLLAIRPYCSYFECVFAMTKEYIRFY